MTAGERDRLLASVAGRPLTLDRIAEGAGRVATVAHPYCQCNVSGAGKCPQHHGIWGRRYVKAPELAL